jgi:hypothetical protein
MLFEKAFSVCPLLFEILKISDDATVLAGREKSP